MTKQTKTKRCIAKKKRCIAKKKCEENGNRDILTNLSQIIQISTAFYGAYKLSGIASDVGKVTNKTLKIEKLTVKIDG